MRRRLTARRTVTMAGLVFAWCALWGSGSPANLLSGLAVALVLVIGLDVGPAGIGRIHLVPLLRFAGLVTKDLARSTASVAWEILTPTDRTEEAIVAVRVPVETRAHLLLMVVSVTVTPGTAVVDADPDTGTLYLHILHRRRAGEVTAHVQRLAALACAGLPLVESSGRPAEATP